MSENLADGRKTLMRVSAKWPWERSSRQVIYKDASIKAQRKKGKEREREKRQPYSAMELCSTDEREFFKCH